MSLLQYEWIPILMCVFIWLTFKFSPEDLALLTKSTFKQTYLRNRKEQNVMSSIEDGMRRTSRDFDAFVAKNVTMEWEAQKQRIFEHFGLAPRTAAASAGGAQADTFGNSTFNGGLSAFGVSSFGRSKLSASFGPGATGRGSVWARSAMGNSVLGRSTTANMAGAPAGKLFSDIDPSRQMELSRQVQLRQQQLALAVKRMNEVRLGAGTADGSIFPVMKVFGDITGASGNDMVGPTYSSGGGSLKLTRSRNS